MTRQPTVSMPCTYVLSATLDGQTVVKIGAARSFEQRFAQLEREHGDMRVIRLFYFPSHNVKAFKFEAQLHKRFEAYRFNWLKHREFYTTAVIEHIMALPV